MITTSRAVEENHPEIAAGQFEAVIFDLDGVITDTARLHAAAWKRLFDAFLERRQGPAFRPFDIDTDYLAHVDGKPRVDGVRDFLAARGIALADGAADDPPGTETIAGLGNAKNRLFLDLLHLHGVQVYDSSVELLRNLRAEGFATAVVTASKNCQMILEAAGLAELFDARVDGREAERLGLAGKPAPDSFLEAAARLGVEPARAVVIEDALAGVAAGRHGGFGLVIGVGRHGPGDALGRAGADAVVTDLGLVRVVALPSALAGFDRLLAELRGRRPLLFLDYDGTLTPIRGRPEQARLSDIIRHLLQRLAASTSVAIVSGRDLGVIRDMVGLDTLVYAGSHGFDIAGPGGLELEHPEALRFLPALDAAEQALRAELAGVDGALIERKRFTVAAHYRQVAAAGRDKLASAVDAIASRQPDLVQTAGKMVHELRPRLDWDKGKAVLWLLDALAPTAAETVPIYIGDDVTDEDAFRALSDRGIGIQVSARPRRTAAGYRLAGPAEVRRFLARLAKVIER